MAKRKGPSKPAQYGGLVFQLIPSAPKSISCRELQRKLNLSRHQVESGVAYLRDTYPNVPLVSSQDGYTFTTNERQVKTFQQMRMLVARTTVRRVFRGVILPFIKINAPMMEPLITKQFERLMQDIGDLVS